MNTTPAFLEGQSTGFLETALLLQTAIAATGGGGGGSSIISGPVASLPAPGTAGRLYITTDANYFYFDNGSAWVAFGLINPVLTPPTSNLFPVIPNGGTLTYANGHLKMVAPGSGGDNIRMAVKTVPISTPYSVTTLISTSITAGVYHYAGIAIYDAGSGKHLAYGPVTYPSGYIATYLNSYNAFGPGGTIVGNGGGNNPSWLKFLNNGTTINFYTSPDGLTWTLFYSQNTTAFLPAITHWGIFSDNVTATVASTCTCYSWLEGTS